MGEVGSTLLAASSPPTVILFQLARHARGGSCARELKILCGAPISDAISILGRAVTLIWPDALRKDATLIGHAPRSTTSCSSDASGTVSNSALIDITWMFD